MLQNSQELENPDLVQIKKWIEIGLENVWISAQNEDPDCMSYRDPVFDEKVFQKCDTIDELIERLNHGNWCLGQAFYYKNLCFINQINAGDEWMVIRDEIPFESVSYLYNDGKWDGYSLLSFRAFLEDVFRATDEQLKNLEYKRQVSVITYEKCRDCGKTNMSNEGVLHKGARFCNKACVEAYETYLNSED